MCGTRKPESVFRQLPQEATIVAASADMNLAVDDRGNAINSTYDVSSFSAQRPSRYGQQFPEIQFT